MERKPFVKGEHVIAITDDKRDKNMELIVIGMGKKWITCVPEDRVAGSGWEERFENDGKFYRMEGRWSYRLYHSLEERAEEEAEKRLMVKFKDDAESGVFTVEEIRKFYEIHNAGVQ